MAGAAMQLLFSDTGAELGPIDSDQVIDLYRHRVPEDGSAWLRTNFVVSLDGSVQGPDGRSGSLNTPSDQRLFAMHRALADAVLVGAETARVEGYRAVDLTGWQRELRAATGLAAHPLLVVVSRSLQLGVELADPGGGSVMIVTTEDRTAEELAPFERAGIEVVQAGHGDVDLPAAVAGLAARNYRRLLCEGGPRLHRNLLDADLVDELSLTVAPVVLGGRGHRLTAGDDLVEARSFSLAHALHAADGTLFLSYRRTR